MMTKHSHFLSNTPIGIFDSGVGGLTIAQKIMQFMPNEQIVYLGDTARMPYGGKCGDTIRRYAIENTVFLMHSDIKLLVVACNTAVVHSIGKLRQLFNVPIIDVVEAGVSEVVATTKNKKVAVIGTKGTIDSDVYKSEICMRLPQAEVISIACPLLVPLVEENYVSHPAARLILQEYLAPLREKDIDTLLLGCTHYPLLATLIEEELKGVKVIDPAACCATMAMAQLKSLGLEADCDVGVRDHRFCVSEDPQKFKNLATHFLGKSLIHVEKIATWI